MTSSDTRDSTAPSSDRFVVAPDTLPSSSGGGLGGASVHSEDQSSTTEQNDLTLEEQQSNEEKLQELARQGVNPQDVLCGRDKYSHIHPGNTRYRKIIESHRAAYQSAPSRDQKTQITIRIVSMVRGYGGRFLKLEKNNVDWVDVGDMYAREKVSHALRSAKDPDRPRIKKVRKVVKHIPSEEEETLFQETLKDQQQIFQELIEKEAAGILDLNLLDTTGLVLNSDK